MNNSAKKYGELPAENQKETAVQSIRRAADILNCISDNVNSVTDIATKCSLSKSTVHRLLRALSESELVMQDPISHKYFLGDLIIKLISTPLTTQEYLTSCARHEMNRLAESTGETVSLGIKMGLKNINIHVINSKNDLKVDGANLRIRPVYEGIDGLVLLSQLDDHQIANILNNINREPRIKKETIKPEALISKIQQIRQQGYAYSNSELSLGVTCISAPVKNYSLPAVLNLVGPEFRMKPRMADFTRELLKSTTHISDNLSTWHDPHIVH
jgi:IclR family KDG regulon transcriptional repressor